ncbi:HpcH/HpaI aldolase/citrate lyase family protein [Pseudonocardia sp. WMMC193]|uniref:HpcH/HpaI aldolase family protein n=1 Tax=Pseudonocardia sp. WMMC193 TaxID=2911965 RepID=UPI001F00D27D|nr:aldolase/citrate lyase family protein [Pseudonocardia sp. WMMC193]MCF7552319.1 aldolase/citrate lyase family protein [Pseudonocardia sp. WMMC193]
MTAFRTPGRTAIGTWVKLPTSDSVELLARAGFDFLVVDMEHAPLDVLTVHQLLGTARGCGVPALVRVPDRSPSTISRVLDSGASGVLVPHVDTVADARSVVSAGRFPPHGSRGYGPTVRAGAWGADVPGYRAAGEQVAVVPQLESREAVAAAREIGAVEGVGALFVGPADLAVATGLDASSAEFAALLDDVASAAKELELPLGTAVGTAAAARALPRHHDFVLIGNDASLLGSAARAVVADAR